MDLWGNVKTYHTVNGINPTTGVPSRRTKMVRKGLLKRERNTTGTTKHETGGKV